MKKIITRAHTKKYKIHEAPAQNNSGEDSYHLEGDNFRGGHDITMQPTNTLETTARRQTNLRRPKIDHYGQDIDESKINKRTQICVYYNGGDEGGKNEKTGEETKQVKLDRWGEKTGWYTRRYISQSQINVSRYTVYLLTLALITRSCMPPVTVPPPVAASTLQQLYCQQHSVACSAL